MNFFLRKKNKYYRHRSKVFFKSNKTKSSKRKKYRFAIITIFILILIIFYYILFLSDYFKIQSVQIDQTRIITDNDLKDFVLENISSNKYNIFPNNNIFLLEKENLGNLISESFSEIETLVITKEYPNKLKIDITEKYPLILWCRMDECFYLDKSGTVFAKKSDINDSEYDEKFIKIIEEETIEEEAEEEIIEEKNIVNNDEDIINNEIISDENIENNDKKNSREADNKVSFTNITINDKVTDEDFINFSIILNENINSFIDFNVKYYKTKGTKTRELIAYTDKNIRIYFDTTEDAIAQLSYLNDFLSGGIDDSQVNSLDYIYVKSGNRIFYK